MPHFLGIVSSFFYYYVTDKVLVNLGPIAMNVMVSLQ